MACGLTFAAAALLAGFRPPATPPAAAVRPAAPAPVPSVSPLFAAEAVTTFPSPVRPAPASPLAFSPAQKARLAVIAAATPPPPAPSGPACPGLVVCDPVAAGDLAAFGVGCGRWLHLMVGGQPALGRTPLLGSLLRARLEMGRTDLCLTPAQARALTAMLGITHVATGELHGTPADCVLTYRLWRVPGLVPVGPPMNLAGSEDQVVAGLPALTCTLAARLGVAHPAVPATVALSPTELGLIGGMSPSSPPSDAQLGQLAAAAERSPLAGMAVMETEALDDQGVLNRTVASLMRQASGNALVIAGLADKIPTALRPYAAAVAGLVRQHPRSYLLAEADGMTQAVWGTRAGEWRAAQRAVADAPASPAAWHERALVLSSIAEDLRRGRTAGQLSDAEWAALNPLYEAWEEAEQRATGRDSRYAGAWKGLATAATFTGDEAQARWGRWGPPFESPRTTPRRWRGGWRCSGPSGWRIRSRWMSSRARRSPPGSRPRRTPTTWRGNCAGPASRRRRRPS